MICYCCCCKNIKAKNWGQPETHGPNLEVVDPIEVVVHQVAVVGPSQPVPIQNTECLEVENQDINDLPTFDEALKMEIVNEELPDYEKHKSYPVYI